MTEDHEVAGSSPAHPTFHFPSYAAEMNGASPESGFVTGQRLSFFPACALTACAIASVVIARSIGCSS